MLIEEGAAENTAERGGRCSYARGSFKWNGSALVGHRILQDRTAPREVIRRASSMLPEYSTIVSNSPCLINVRTLSMIIIILNSKDFQIVREDKLDEQTTRWNAR